MLRINLLPPYVFDRQQKITLLAIWGAVWLAVVLVFANWFSGIRGQVDVARTDRDKAQERADNWKKSDEAISAIDSEVADTRTKRAFIEDAKKWNNAWPAIYTKARNWTDPDVVLENLTLQDPTTIQISGYAPKVAVAMRWWRELLENQDFDHINFNLPPRDPSGVAGAPAANPGQGRFGGFGAGRRGGMTGGFGGGRMGGLGALGGMRGGGFGGGRRGGMMGGFGGRGLGGANRGSVGITNRFGKPGIEFTATITLKSPALSGAPPSWPGGGGGGLFGGKGGGGLFGGKGGGGGGGFGAGRGRGLLGGGGGGAAPVGRPGGLGGG
jgi:hypothetical protein